MKVDDMFEILDAIIVLWPLILWAVYYLKYYIIFNK
jgi:hypothetical protein